MKAGMYFVRVFHQGTMETMKIILAK